MLFLIYKVLWYQFNQQNEITDWRMEYEISECGSLSDASIRGQSLFGKHAKILMLPYSP